MTPAEQVTFVAPGDSGVDALNELGRRQVNQLPVVEDGRVRGMLRREDILRWLSLYGGAGFRDART